MLAPIPVNEAMRQQAVNSIAPEIFSGDTRLDQITEYAAQTFNAPVSFITIIEKNRAIFVSGYGSDATEIPRDQGICSHVISEINSRSTLERVYEIPDAYENKKFMKHPLVVRAPNVRFYISYTLQSHDGFNLGTLCVLDRVPRKFSGEDRFHLAIIGEVANKIILGDI